MTTELHANPILSEPSTPVQHTDRHTSIPINRWLPRHLQPESSTDTTTTGDSTPEPLVDPLDETLPAQVSLPASTRTPSRRRRPTLEDASSTPRSRLVKARTAGEYLQHHDRQRKQFLVERGGQIQRRLSFVDDYGLDELRAPPILPDRERRKSLEHAWAHKPEIPKQLWAQRVRDDCIIACWIAFFAIWGLLARMGLEALSTYPGQPVFPLIWPQFVGCAVMGFLLQDKILFPKQDRYVPLYIGLTTGFCGSLTSFSSFMWNSFQSMANLDPVYDRGPGKDVLALASQVIVTLSLSIAALRFGAHIAQVVSRWLPSIREGEKSVRWLDWIGVGLGVCVWAGVGIMTGLIPQWRRQLFAAVFGPVGLSSSRCDPCFGLTSCARCHPTLATLPLQPSDPLVPPRHIHCKHHSNTALRSNNTHPIPSKHNPHTPLLQCLVRR